MISIPVPIKDITTLTENPSLQEKLEKALLLAEECATLPGVRGRWLHGLERGLLEVWDIPGGLLLVSVQKYGVDRLLNIDFLMGDLRSLLWARRYLRLMAKSKECVGITFETDNKRLAALADESRYSGYWRV